MINRKSRLNILFIVLCGSLGMSAAMLLDTGSPLNTVIIAQAQGDEGENGTPPPVEPSSDNSYCVVCHSQPGRVMTLEDGSVLDLYVNPTTIADSVHSNLGCVDCHGKNTFPHSGPSPKSVRAYTVEAAQLCSGCHNELLADSAHLEKLAAGNLQAATCVDCHGAHDIPATENHPTLVAGVCSDCHEDTLVEWNESPHANMGSLGCAVCHLPHGQQLRIENTNALCLNCHKVPGEIYIHAKHLESEYEVSCVNCHMALDPDIEQVTTGIEPTDHRMVVQTLSCNQCHEELEESGVWAQLVDTNEEVIIERDALREQITQLEEQLSDQNASGGDVDYVQLIQGLIVGLGIGIVIILILVPRLSRNSNGNMIESGEQNNHHESE